MNAPPGADRTTPVGYSLIRCDASGWQLDVSYGAGPDGIWFSADDDIESCTAETLR